MGIGSIARDPEQPHGDHIDELLSHALREIRAAGHSPSQIDLSIEVTTLSDQDIDVTRQRATAAGLGRLVLVDDQRPPRPGTVPRALLGPAHVSSLADARAARVLRGQQ